MRIPRGLPESLSCRLSLLIIEGNEIDTLHCLRDVMNGDYFIVPHNHRKVIGMEIDLQVDHEKNMSAPWPTPRRAVQHSFI